MTVQQPGEEKNKTNREATGLWGTTQRRLETTAIIKATEAVETRDAPAQEQKSDLWQRLADAPQQTPDGGLWERLTQRLQLIKPRPRLRQDLITSQQAGQDGQTYYVVKDPQTHRFYRFKANEYFVLSLLDGHHEVRDVVRAYYAHFGRAIRPQTVVKFFDQLAGYELLEQGRENLYAALPQRLAAHPVLGRLGRWLSFQYTLPDTDAFLQNLYAQHAVRLWFTRSAILLLTLVVLAGLGGVVAQWGVAMTQVTGLFRSRAGWLSALATFYASTLAVVVVHELAHALTCVHLGGHVSKMGIMLYYLTPAAFADTSDAWLFPHKWQRIAVSFAGPFSTLVFAGLGGLLWWAVPGQSAGRALGLVLLASTLPATLINLNPFLEYDGYYILSDYAEIPNLRRRSFDYCQRRLQAGLGCGPALPDVPDRERRFFLTYGAISAVYFVAGLVLPLFYQIPVLVRSLGPVAGGIITALLVLLLARRWVSRLVSRWER